MIESGLVRGFLHGSGARGIVLAHGAGSDCRSRLLVTVAEAFAAAGWAALRIDLPYRQARPTGPPFPATAARDREGLKEAAAWLRSGGCEQVYIGGHSYGGRQASMLAAEDPTVAAGLLLMSYPLHPPRKPDQMRVAHFPEIRTPAIFMHGARDPFATPDELTAAVQAIPARTRVEIVQGAGHELKPVLSNGALAVAPFMSLVSELQP